MINKKNMIILIGSLAVIAAFVGSSILNPNRSVNYLQASYAQSYNSVPDLYKNADIVVIGHFSEIESEGLINNSTIPYSNFSFKIDQIIKGTIKESIIEIHQTGGNYQDKTFQLKEDPLYKVGDKALLFLSQGSPDLYHVVGGPQGRFPIVEGKVSSINHLVPDSEIFIRADVPPTDLDTFVEKLKSMQ